MHVSSYIISITINGFKRLKTIKLYNVQATEWEGLFYKMLKELTSEK